MKMPDTRKIPVQRQKPARVSSQLRRKACKGFGVSSTTMQGANRSFHHRKTERIPHVKGAASATPRPLSRVMTTSPGRAAKRFGNLSRPEPSGARYRKLIRQQAAPIIMVANSVRPRSNAARANTSFMSTGRSEACSTWTWIQATGNQIRNARPTSGGKRAISTSTARSNTSPTPRDLRGGAS